ncbi:Piwi-domain-containing protein [Dichomitus squalens]|uniref:Piwi-domain-containing protein n=1 Tax=Dichomitus squalens TaxID=114155 RepID=A0A4Q9Q6R9_9APHY|nr:Piwi-domain-containing protein [Dichomitus squalens]TBU63045.1 Piwi-domain-containing protein [Dichomitus squalens]
MQPRNASVPPDNNTKSLSLLQLIVRQAPNIRHHFPADARAFYDIATAKYLDVGLSVWRGYFQSVRPTLGRLLINIDVSHALFYAHGPLINLMMQHLGVHDVRGLHNLQPHSFRQLRSFLKGVVVSFTVARDMRPRPISDLVDAAGLQEFDKENERCSVQRHFETKYQVPVQYPRAVGVKIGKTAIFPAEFCEVQPGQIYRKQIPPRVQKEFLNIATQRPDVRFRAITEAVRHDDVFKYRSSDYVREAGMQVNDRPVDLKGKVLAPPLIKYGHGHVVQLGRKAGHWNLRGCQLYKPGVLQSWMVVCYYNVDRDQVQHFVRRLSDALRGLAIPDKMPELLPGNGSNPTAVLEEYGRKLKPTLVLCIMPENSAETRRAIKYWGDCARGVSTQCVLKGKWDHASEQYYANVALKQAVPCYCSINSRMGGVNSVIEHPEVGDFLRTAMIVGADVGHPGPGITNRPSVAGVVASLNLEASIMTSYSSVQQPRQEMIEDLGDMIISALNDWRKYRRESLGSEFDRPPSVIIFYRDGVSEGEYDRITQYEIHKIHSELFTLCLFTRMKLPRRVWPKIVFIVVTKRHHVRFFAKNSEDEDRSGNCPAGLLVDDSITNPHVPNFYLQSHAGLLGTSRPAHYSVLANEAQLDIDFIQRLTFHLCHTYASATRSVSIPAPVYYADRLCLRLPFLCGNGASLSDTASDTTSGETFDLETWKRAVALSKPFPGFQLRMPFI